MAHYHEQTQHFRRNGGSQSWDRAAIFVSALPIAIVGLISAIYQGKVASAAIGIIAKRPEELGKAITFPVVVETYAVWPCLLLSF